MTETATAQNEYVAFWNDVLVEKFERFRNILMGGLSYHSDVGLNALEVRTGARVLDIGCGWGDTALQLARRVGPDGEVWGLDCCEPFLEKGRRDATEAGLDNVHFIAADVETYPFKTRFDLCFSRFGMMFFASPVAAMRNVHKALKPGGRLNFIVWRTIDDNPWLGLPKELVLRYLPPPGEDAETCGPGPFSMASPDLVTAQLEAGGFTDITFDRIDGPVMVGRNVEQAVAFQLAIGPAGEVFREAGEEAERRRGEIESALADQLAAFQRPDGSIVMGSSSWSITAHKPAA
ncbi:class I SAM-dependent methyltransferase [Ectothiorhodospiraceae bacterium WFHF3C12]|nr:class I SAM-dependent methyltransferase [Ectothiorhodospiraceae bacterium WFHF3C12]